jgi:Carboxypeptidase regulatory-like domain
VQLNMKRTCLVLIAIALGLAIVGSVCAQDESGPTSTLRFVVLRDSDGKPVRNAEIVLHPVGKKGKQSKGEMELKTDSEGKTSIDGIPYGPLQVQVLAPHFQTFGADYDINKAELEITVKLKHPGDQYSAYDDKKPQ